MRIAQRFPTCAIAVAMVLLQGYTCVAAADEPTWFEGGRPNEQAQQAVALLGAAASHGLEPQDYHAVALRQAVAAASSATPALAPDKAEKLDQALTEAMLRYLGDLHQGRIDPRQIHHDFSPARRDAFDAADRVARGAGGAAAARSSQRSRARPAALRTPARRAGALPCPER